MKHTADRILCRWDTSEKQHILVEKNSRTFYEFFKVKAFHKKQDLVIAGEKMIHKISKDVYYMGIAEAVAVKSNCICVSYGCIIVRHDQIISTGYVGAPRKTKDCIDLGFCIRREKNIKSGSGYEMCRSVHSEMNAIINAARAGVSILGGDMYLFTAKNGSDNKLIPVKAYPCLMCKKIIINAGISRFIGNNEDRSISIYTVDDWAKNWQKLNDITNDPEQYCINHK